MIKRENKDRAIQLMAANPNMDLGDVSDEVGVSVSTLKNWKKEPGVGEIMYETYISSLGGEIPAVISSMVREAKLGNVQAARLVLEAGGKLVKRISVKVSSPYDQFLKAKEIEHVDVIDAEELPQRDERNNKPRTRNREEKERVEKILTKDYSYKPEITPEQRAKNRKKSLASYRRLKRAKKVGLEPLGRKTGEAKREWYAELEKREKEMEIKT